MGFILLILYLVLWYLRPYELVPFLAALRPMLWLSVLTAVISVLTYHRRSLPVPQMYAMAGLIILVILSIAINGRLGDLTDATIAWEEVGSAALVFFIVILTVNSPVRLRILISVIVLLSLIQTMQGLLAYHFGIMADKYVLNQMDESVGALRRIQSLGLMNNPNNLAQGLLTAVPLAGLAWHRGRWLRNLLFVLLPLSLLLYGTYLTFSRTVVVAGGVVSLFAFRNRLGRIPSVIAAILLTVALVGFRFGGGREFSMEESSARGRLYAWSAGMEMLRSSPIFGMGYGSFVDVNSETGRTAHNSFVLCFAELGLLGYFFWLALLFMTWIELSAVKKLPPGDFARNDLRRCAKVIQLSFVAFLACAFFASRAYNLVLFLLIGMAGALGEMARQEGNPEIIPPMAGWVPRVAVLEAASIVFIYVGTRIGMLG